MSFHGRAMQFPSKERNRCRRYSQATYILPYCQPAIGLNRLRAGRRGQDITISVLSADILCCLRRRACMHAAIADSARRSVRGIMIL